MRPVIDAADDSKPFIGIPFFLLPRMDHIEKKQQNSRRQWELETNGLRPKLKTKTDAKPESNGR